MIWAMSAIGPKQTCVAALHESANNPKRTWLAPTVALLRNSIQS
jgi:hypothetical protein